MQRNDAACAHNLNPAPLTVLRGAARRGDAGWPTLPAGTAGKSRCNSVVGRPLNPGPESPSALQQALHVLLGPDLVCAASRHHHGDFAATTAPPASLLPRFLTALPRMRPPRPRPNRLGCAAKSATPSPCLGRGKAVARPLLRRRVAEAVDRL